MKKFYNTEIGYLLVWALILVLIITTVSHYVSKIFPGLLSPDGVVVVSSTAAVLGGYLLLQNKKSKK
jgi:hypothetical protein